MASSHVVINVFVVATHILIGVCIFIFYSNISLEKTQTFVAYEIIGAILFLAINMSIGYLFRKDLYFIQHREKMTRCTCSYIAAAQAQFSRQQTQQLAQQQQLQAAASQHLGTGPGSHYITGPDGSRYMIARPPPIGAGTRSNSNANNGNNNHDNSDNWPLCGPMIQSNCGGMIMS